jgi:hypothetical protein
MLKGKIEILEKKYIINLSNIMKNKLTLLLCIMLTINIYSQSSFLNEGQSGLGIGGLVFSDKNGTGFGGTIGYSLYGVFDLGFSIDRYEYKEKDLGEDLSVITMTPSINYFIVKQNGGTPLSVTLHAGYDKYKFYNYAYEQNNIKVKGDFYFVGGSVLGDFMTVNSITIQPSLSIYYTWGEFNIDYNSYKETQEDELTSFTFKLALIYETIRSNKFVIAPRVSLSEGTTSFGIGLTFIFSMD